VCRLECNRPDVEVSKLIPISVDEYSLMLIKSDATANLVNDYYYSNLFYLRTSIVRIRSQVRTQYKTTSV
jgi:hypothetical protein